MATTCEKELRQLEQSFKSGNSGMTTNEYCSYYHQLSQKIKNEKEIYKKQEILVCDYNEAIKEAIYVINSHSHTGSNMLNMPKYNQQIGEPLRTKIIDELKAKLKKP